MSTNLDLTALATDTANKLACLWDELGIPSTERQEFLDTLANDVARIYSSRVEGEKQRKFNTENEISQLQTTIENLIHCMEDKSSVPKSNNLPLIAYRDVLESTRASLQEVWDTRYNELKALETKLFSLYSDIGSPCENSYSSIGEKISLPRIQQYTNEINRVSSIKTERTHTITSLSEEINSLWAELGFSPRDEYDTCIVTPSLGQGLGWTMKTIQLLQDKVQTLTAEKSVREERIMIIGQQITALWKRLSTPEHEQTTFLESHAGIGDDVINACETYLATKQEEFAARLVDLISGTRTTITSLWDELRWGTSQREEAFSAYFMNDTNQYTDDLYLQHENYITSLQTILEETRPMLKAVEKREAILKEKIEYETLMADPQRLLAKSSSAARLREEKLERRVKKELPAVSKRLREQCLQWETTYNKPFTIDGQRYVDVLDAEDAAESKAKEEARHKRENRNATNEENSTVSSTAASHHHQTVAAPAPPSRPTSAPASRPSVYRPSVLGSTATNATLKSAKPSATASQGTKKTSVPATSSASTVGPVHDNDDMCTVLSGATADHSTVDAPIVAPKAPSVAPPPLSSTSSNVMKPKTLTSKSSSANVKSFSGSQSVILSATASEAVVSGEAREAAARMLQAL